MENKERFEIDSQHSGTRLDVFLTECFSDKSRTYVRHLIDEGLVLVNQQQVKAGATLKTGDYVEVSKPQDQVLNLTPVALQLDIVYEDHDMIVINKPKGMIVHPSASTRDQVTLVHALMAHCQDLSTINGVLRPGIVHRIDKDTTGLIVVAKNDEAHHDLAKQLAERTMHRSYYALSQGVFPHDLAKIDAPIGRDPLDRQKMGVTARNSKPAVTHVRVVERFSGYTLFSCTLDTGRTHQIRVHLKHIGYPIVGDPKYGHKNEFGIKRQCLHAYQLTLTHPRTHQSMTFEAPLPQEFSDLLELLRRRETHGTHSTDLA